MTCTVSLETLLLKTILAYVAQYTALANNTVLTYMDGCNCCVVAAAEEQLDELHQQRQ